MSLKMGDLRGIVGKKIHVDEYSSKMGEDDDVIVVSFKVRYYDPALELTNYVEKGYDWVLDADTSSGEMEDGSYLVFVEMLRRPSVPAHIMRLLKDMEGVTENDLDGYEFTYRKSRDYLPVTMENLRDNIPLTPRDYKSLYGEEEPAEPETPEEETPKDDLADWQMAAGLAPKPKPITDSVLKHYVNLSKR